jgi:hypothetical protein
MGALPGAHSKTREPKTEARNVGTTHLSPGRKKFQKKPKKILTELRYLALRLE